MPTVEVEVPAVGWFGVDLPKGFTDATVDDAVHGIVRREMGDRFADTLIQAAEIKQQAAESVRSEELFPSAVAGSSGRVKNPIPANP